MAPDRHAHPLDESEVDSDPLVQFGRWYDEARDAGVPMPEAMALATASADGTPSLRMVLLKGFDERGFVFFTSGASRKGRELEHNPRAALMFYWEPLGRQLRIEGPVTPVSADETAAYARSRPRGSQLSALASPQSEPVESRAWLEQRVAELERRHAGRPVPVPERWAGYRLAPTLFELWQNRDDRLHDRLEYRPRPGGGWTLVRLAP